MSRRQRYAALLRGVSPMNCSMPALKQCLEAVGFSNVKTVLSSGNAVFDAPVQEAAALAAKCESAMQRTSAAASPRWCDRSKRCGT
jgi:uncharacterized protein (DUF1697 family)